jgi:membrane fusion protein, multidrug efflux system
MKKRMWIMLIGVGILFGGIFIWKVFMGFMFKRYMASHVPIATVSAMKVQLLPWQQRLKSTGSVRAIKGVNVTTSLAGMVQKIYFTPGAIVNEGTILVQLNADAELGQLQSLRAQAALADITYVRDKAQYAIHAVSKQTLDTDFQNLKSLQGQVAEQAAIVEKKTIRAPFTGRLGINNVNPGQYINTGDKIVPLQTLDPIYVDFYVPQQSITQLQIGQNVVITSDSFPGKKFMGKITTVEPVLDTTTRNVEVEATMANPKFELTPGMFSLVDVDIGKPKQYLTLPQTAVSFNPYGSVIYLVEEKGKDKDDKGNPILIVKQVFVTTGETRGDQITILSGLKENDMVVTSGQLKLKNGSRIAINNSIVPANNPDPHVSNEH